MIQSTDRHNTPRTKLLTLDPSADHGTSIVFRARVHNARIQSVKLAFLVLRQQSATIQAVVAANSQGTVTKHMVKWAASINPESIVLVHGLVQKSPEPISSASISDLEIHITQIHVIAAAEPQLPIQLEDASRPELTAGTGKEHEGQVDESGRPVVSLKARLDNRVIDLRTVANNAIFRISSGVCTLFREYLLDRQFTEIHTPKLIAAASEGGSNVFEVTYFDRPAFLAQSPQLYKQMLIAADFERVFEVAPVFRAEDSNTHRHMTEFTGLDLEMAFEEHYHEVLDLIQGLFQFLFAELPRRFGREIAVVRQQYPCEPFRCPAEVLRIPFSEGIAMLRAAGVDLDPHADLSTADERHLGQLVREKHDTDFYVLDQFPLAVRPFYTMPSPHDPAASNSYDIFMRGEEIMSGAQRVHEVGLLKERMGMVVPAVDPEGEGIRDYVDAFRYGCPPHAGGGIGLERVVMLYLGLGNVRKSCAFPRDPQRLRP